METHSPAPVRVASRRLSFDTAAVWALSLTGALAVIAFIPSSSISFIYTKVFILTLGAIVSLALYILTRLTRGNIILPPLLLLGALWLVPIAYGLSTLFSGKPIGMSFFGTQLESDTSGFILLIALLATLVALVFRRTEQYKTFFCVASVTYVLVVVAQVLFIIAAHIFPNDVSATTNIVGSFLDMGIFVGAGIVLSLTALRFLMLSRKLTVALYIGIIASLFLLALVNSTLIWSLVALVAFAFFVEAIMHRGVHDTTDADDGASDMTPSAPDEGKKMLIPALVVLALSIFFIIGSNTIGQSFASAVGISTVDVRPSWTSTFDTARATYATSRIFGSGPGTFGADWLLHRDPSINETVFWNIDFVSGIGWIPTAFVTTGLVGALAWILFLVAFLFFGIRFLLFRAPAEAYVRFIAIATFVISLYLLASAIFLVPGPAMLALTFIAIGLFISTGRFVSERRERNIVFGRNPALGFLIVFLLTVLLLGSIGYAYVAIERYLADVSYNQAQTALNNGDTVTAYADANRSLVFAQSDRTYELIATAAIVDMNNLANATGTPSQTAQAAFQAALSKGVDAALTATQLAPDNYQDWVTLGSVYQAVVPLKITGAYDNAKTAYQHAVTLNPTNAVLPYTLAQLEIVDGNSAAAETDLQNAIALKSNYTQAIFLYSQLQASEGKAKEALASAESALYFDPTDPTVLFQVGVLRSANGDNDGAIQALTQATEINPQYANAFFFLGVSYAIEKQYDKALAALNSAAALSPDNATALAADIAALKAGKNPFPASSLGALGVAQTPVEDNTTPADSNSDTTGAGSKTPAAPQQ